MFRPPANASLLATYVGTGVQILGMLLVVTTFALLGFLSPSNRGGLMTAAVLLFVLMGGVAGYAAARLYKAFRCAHTTHTHIHIFAADVAPPMWLPTACLPPSIRPSIHPPIHPLCPLPLSPPPLPVCCHRGEQWKSMTLRTALLFPGTVFGVFFVLDLLIWGQRSSGAVPFGTLLALAFLWFGVSVPLTYVGSYYGFRAPAPEDPVRTNKIPRQIPEQPW